MTRNTLRFTVTLDDIEDPLVVADLSGFSSGQDRARRARLLMREGLRALRNNAPSSSPHSPHHGGNAIKLSPIDGNANPTSMPATTVPSPEGPRPGTIEAFDGLDLDVAALKRNLQHGASENPR